MYASVFIDFMLKAFTCPIALEFIFGNTFLFLEPAGNVFFYSSILLMRFQRIIGIDHLICLHYLWKISQSTRYFMCSKLFPVLIVLFFTQFFSMWLLKLVQAIRSVSRESLHSLLLEIVVADRH